MPGMISLSYRSNSWPRTTFFFGTGLQSKGRQ
nr:MAG TPA: hypothetical protein [Caudoviricetes sp.]